MADTAETPTRATVASATALAEEALDSAKMAHQVNEAMAADLTEQAKVLGNIQKEQLALAKLVNGLNEQKGSLVKPSQLDGVMARLEKVEQVTKGATHDWGPAIKSLDTKLTTVADRLDGLATGAGDGLEETSGKVVALIDAMNNLTTYTKAVADNADAFQANVYQRLGALEQGGAPRGVTTLGVGAKVLQLMEEVAFIGKSREAKIETRGDNFTYMFRGIDDAQDAVGAAMRKVGLIMRTQVLENRYELTPVEKRFANGGGMTQLWSTCVLTMRYAFVDPVDMSEFAFEMVGEGKDVSDKSASKAASMACKYALFQALMIPVKGQAESDGEDPQITSDTPEPEQQAAAPQAAPPATPPVSEETRRTRATAAVQAVRVLHQLPKADEAMARLNKITDQVKREGLKDVMVGDHTVEVWINSTWKVLKGLLEVENRGTDQGATRQDVDPNYRPPATSTPPPPPPAEPDTTDDPWGSYNPPSTDGPPW